MAVQMAALAPMTGGCFSAILTLSTLVQAAGPRGRKIFYQGVDYNEVLSLLRRFSTGKRRFFLPRVREADAHQESKRRPAAKEASLASEAKPETPVQIKACKPNGYKL